MSSASSRIERKREVDRKAQRAIRERTKNRIAQLEQEVEYYKRLSEEGRTGLLKELGQLREENRCLRQKLDAIKSIVSVDEGPGQSDNTTVTTSTLSGLQGVSSTSQHDTTTAPTTPDISIYGGMDLGLSLQGLTTLQGTGYIYGRIYEVSPEHVAEVGNIDMSLVVKAINEGWETLDISTYTHPLVRILHDIDQFIFAQSSQTLRLAVMYKNYHLLKYFISPKAENRRVLPRWIQPRAPQPVTPDAVLEFFPWPFVREILTQNYPRYGADTGFTKEFSRCYRFYWPFPFQNAFTYDMETQSYKISSLFEQFCRDLRSWGIDRSFFEVYPEFAGGFRLLASREQVF